MTFRSWILLYTDAHFCSRIDKLCSVLEPRTTLLLSSILLTAFFTSVYVWSLESISLHSSYCKWKDGQDSLGLLNAPKVWSTRSVKKLRLTLPSVHWAFHLQSLAFPTWFWRRSASGQCSPATAEDPGSPLWRLVPMMKQAHLVWCDSIQAIIEWGRGTKWQDRLSPT